MRCQEEQPKGDTCKKCNERFAVYYCDICVFYDNEAEKKGIFHCEKCGICRVGGKETTFHCDVCECCMNILLKDNHQCKPKRFKEDCPVCLSGLQNSTMSASMLRCGHSMHSKCFK